MKIINKKGPLNNEEWNLMKQHPDLGMKILTELKISNQTIIQGVYSHHEQADGTGYPLKLKGQNIPLVAKVISICDVFDAITTKRSYAKVLSPDQALALMKFDMPGKFDNELFIIFDRPRVF